MARKSINYTMASSFGRDAGKCFVITEMPAAQAEAWATRALLALMKSGIELPPNYENLGVAAMVEIGFKALSSVSWKDLEPLLDEMMICVRIMPDPSKPQLVRPLILEDIEEIMTFIELRKQVWKLHTDFS